MSRYPSSKTPLLRRAYSTKSLQPCHTALPKGHITAGSLLEFVLENHSFSMPVGRIQYFFIEPLGFEEFLLAKNETHLLSAIEKVSIEKSLNTSLHDNANQLFKEFVIVGGMPEAVSTWIKTSSLESLAEVHNNLINTYQDDFTKYAGKLTITHLEDVLYVVPKLLTKKFIYSHVDPSVRHESIKQALSLLLKARLCHKVQNSSANGIPLGAEVKSKIFKIILIDVGLVSTMLGLKLHQFMSEKPWKLAIRFYAGPVKHDHITSKTTTGDLNDYELISLPFYLLGQVYRLLGQFSCYTKNRKI